MSITIEKLTAEAALEALKQLPALEMERLKELLESTSMAPAVNESENWNEEDIEDFRRSTHRLIEKRLGPEPHSYD